MPRIMQTPELFYVHDPMCSWCYAFAPVWERVHGELADRVAIGTVLGGLAPDSDTLMPADMRERIRGTWQRIESVVPGTQFNYDFWEDCEPRRSTYPSCRAVIAARDQGIEHEYGMVTAIQRAYYREARNPSLTETLTELAGEMGLDESRFASTLVSPECEHVLQEEIGRAVSLGVRGFPSLVLVLGSAGMHIPQDYSDAELVAKRIEEGLQTLKERVRDDSSNANAQTVTLTVTGESLFNGTAPPSR